MMRNLKVLGTALVAVLAMSAVMASMASADDLTSESTPVTLTGTQEGELTKFVTTAGSTTCTTATLTGTSIATPTTEGTATPAYSGCTCIGVACTVDTTGCDFVLRIGGSGSTTATADLVCTGGNEITLTNSKCVVHVKSQSNLSKVEVTNTGSGATRELTAHLEISGIHYTHTEGTGIGKCTTGTGTNGTLTGTAIITGEIPSTNTHVGIFLS